MHGTYCHFSWHANQANRRGHAPAAPATSIPYLISLRKTAPGTPAELGKILFAQAKAKFWPRSNRSWSFLVVLVTLLGFLSGTELYSSSHFLLYTLKNIVRFF